MTGHISSLKDTNSLDSKQRERREMQYTVIHHDRVTYSKARAVPRAFLTRVFQINGLLPSSERCKKSCNEPFSINS